MQKTYPYIKNQTGLTDEITKFAYKTTLGQSRNDDFELTMCVSQGTPDSPPLFNLFIDFVMRSLLDKCAHVGIKFRQLKYRIPASATHPKRTTVGQNPLD